MLSKYGIFGGHRRAVLAVGTVFLMLFGVADAFFCGLEFSASGEAVALHADENGEIHSDTFDSEHSSNHANHEADDDCQIGCVHGHSHHTVPMFAFAAISYDAFISGLKAHGPYVYFSPPPLESSDHPPRA